MSTTTTVQRPRFEIAANKALKAAAGFWFGVAMIGQWMFLAYIVAFYGPSTLTGNFRMWSKNTFLNKSYVPGDTAGNVAFAAHALLAAVIAFGGALQLLPQIRKRAIGVHRWIGRSFFVTALGLSATGLYMEWIRGDRFNMVGAVAITINAVLIILFCILAWRLARAGDIPAHRRWALRAYLVANAQWFTRVGVFSWILINRGPVGIGDNFDGPFIFFWDFGCYLLPLAVLELYLRAKESSAPRQRFATASALIALTLAMAVGIFGITVVGWLPIVKAAYDTRMSIADTLDRTIASSGIDQAESQYHDLKSASPATYNFDEAELNNLGYRLIRKKQIKDAIRIFELNIEAYPKSSNAYDSLGEAYVDDGNRPLAVANYEKALQLNSKNTSAAKKLRALKSPQ